MTTDPSLAPDSVDWPIRLLDAAELPRCMDLAMSRAWPREERKWWLLFEIGRVYGLEDPSGALIGTVVRIPFGAGLASIGMMVVASGYERRGLGGRLMSHALDQAGDAIVYLAATEFGRPLYTRLGFTATGTITRHEGYFKQAESRSTLRGGRSIRPAGPEDLDRIGRLDAAVTGADRSELITRLSSFAEQVSVLADGPEILGYAAAWRNNDITVIGPVIAPDQLGAQALIAELAAPADGLVRLEVEGHRTEFAAWAKGCGLDVGSANTNMIYRANALPGDRSRFFAPTLTAIG